MNKIFLLVFVVILLFGCKNNSSNESDLEESKDTAVIEESSTNIGTIEIEVAQAEENEKLTVAEKSVIFFMLTDKEIKSVIEHYGEYSRYDLEELFRNFKTFAVSSRKVLKDKNINSELTTAYFIELKSSTETILVNRKETSNLIGQIFFDGKNQPVIKYGLMKNKDFTEVVSTYFNVDDYENKEVDSIETIVKDETIEGV